MHSCITPLFFRISERFSVKASNRKVRNKIMRAIHLGFSVPPGLQGVVLSYGVDLIINSVRDDVAEGTYSKCLLWRAAIIP